MTTASPPQSSVILARVRAKLEKPGAVSKALGILIYGRTKAGKTSVLSTMPGKGLVIDVRRKEGGTNVLAQHADRMDIYPIHRWQELDDLMAFLRDPAQKYDWVALDTITGLLALAEESVIGRSNSLSAVPRHLKGNEWGTMGGRIIRLLDMLHEMEMYAIVLAQEKRRIDPELGNVCGPDVIPMLLTPLTEPMAIIGHIKIANVGTNSAPIMEHQLRVKGHPNYYTGLRINRELVDRLPDVIKEPSLRTLIRYYYGKGEPPEAATIPAAESSLETEDDDE